MSRQNRKASGRQPLPDRPPKKISDMGPRELASFVEACGRLVPLLAERSNVQPPLFCTLIFNPDNDDKVSHYVSNARREDMIAALKEAVVQLEAREDMPREDQPL